MKAICTAKRIGSLLLLFAVLLLSLSACGFNENSETAGDGILDKADSTHYLVAVEDEPDTVDFQCTTIFYTVATNVFNRLVEMEKNENNEVVVVPSLAESWEVSEDGCSYTFHLRDGVTFSNGSALTSSDVLYSFSRLLTWPESCNEDIVLSVVGAEQLRNGETDQLEGFQILNDLDFVISLNQPDESFLVGLSTPGASIMDAETTSQAEDRFGKEPRYTVGTGSFILRSWEQGQGMRFDANPDCWEGPPNCEGLDLRFLTEQEELEIMFANGELDILDLDDVGDEAEFFLRGDIYQKRLHQVQQVGLTYIALNEAIAPLDDVRVRKALQLSLNRKVLLDAVYLGYGFVENGIFPRGLYGYNPYLDEIPYDPETAKALLAEAGYPEGFDLKVTVKDSSSQSELTQMRLAADMWAEIGVTASIDVIDESEFMELRKTGNLECYTATWTADFNDPDNFISPFFGNYENSLYRSLCYSNSGIMERVQKAKSILDSSARLQEYWELERIIVQEEAAWIPLFSRQRIYVSSERAQNIQFAWNGSIKNKYREITIDQ